MTPVSQVTVLGVTPLSCFLELPLQHNKQWLIQFSGNYRSLSVGAISGVTGKDYSTYNYEMNMCYIILLLCYRKEVSLDDTSSRRTPSR